ncbi:Pro-Pol polyprotein [Dictyocoela roeselum]|nr:Pro-Pol polyprotein [Dictyocoela roeselum]
MKTLLSDNGKELNNHKLREWCAKKKITQEFSIPYYHQSNGRIERANRTIREALKRSKGPVKLILGEFINNYNKSEHRGIGMSPNEGFLKENLEKITNNQKF